MMDRRKAIVTTVVGLGAWLAGYVGRWSGWYWDNVLMPEPLLIHTSNIIGGIYRPYTPLLMMDIMSGRTWVIIDGEKVPFDEWLKKDVYVRSRAPMTKGQYKIGTNA